MANLVELLQGQLSDQLIGQLSNQFETADTNQISGASSAIFSILTNALAKNTASEGGANSLSNALDNDHDGSVLDNLTDLLGGEGQNMNSRSVNGAGILKHILGNKQSSVIDVISQMSGLNQNATGSLMMKLAPMLLGMLGKQKKQNNFDQGGLTEYLSRSAQSAPVQNKEPDFLTKLLDKDGDGSIMDEVAGMGMKALGGLFKK